MTSILKVDTIQDTDGNNIINEKCIVIHYYYHRWHLGTHITIPIPATNDVSFRFRLVMLLIIINDATTALSGITFFMNSGNIASGNFKLYGIK
jgi:hypothetical protein